MTYTRTFTRCVVGASLLALAGCGSSGVEASSPGSAAQISGPPTFNQTYQVRNPRVCAKVTSPPNAAQAAALIQCDTESDSTGSATPMITLVSNLEVEVGAPRNFMMGPDSWPNIDPSAKVYPIRGKSVLWQCGEASRYPAGQNCYMYPAAPGGQGSCYKTTFGDWTCRMTTGGPKQVQHQKGPTTY